MTKKGSTQLKEYRNELKKIINELETIEGHIRNDYSNVGNIQCADCINSVIKKYRSALNTLNSVDASVLDSLKEAANTAKAAIR